ncbi:MAG: putative lipid II flippase FtsW [Steroidobacteraceae bacterium]
MIRSQGQRQARSRVLHIDSVTVLLVSAIVLLGLVMVTSASISIAAKQEGAPFIYLERQLLLTLAGIAVAGLMLMLPTRLYEEYAVALLLFAGLLLLAVLLPGIGHTVNGSSRWLRLAGFNFQPSELARVLVLLFIARYAVRREGELQSSFSGFFRAVGLLGVFALLLLAEPDFGAAVVLCATGCALLFLAGARWRDLGVIVLIVVAALVALALSADYRVRRLTAFLDPWADPFNSGFQLTQSLIAIGRGEWFGVGLGESIQKLFYLPEAHTDFLFAVLAEELGLAGVLLTIGLFLALAWRALQISTQANEAGLKFQSYVAAGFGIWLGLQAFVNIGVNMGALPTKGLTLPLMSYGRSSLIVAFLWVGLLLRVHHEVMSEARGSASARRGDLRTEAATA